MRAKEAFGFATKKFAGIPSAAFSRLPLYVFEKASVLAIVPILLLFRLLMKVAFENCPAVVWPVGSPACVNNAERIVSGTHAAHAAPVPGGAELVPARAARLA